MSCSPISYLGELRGIDAVTVAQRVHELLGVLELLEAERTLVIDYSAGMRKKIGLAMALLHAPRLLVLDEPFEAVDPVSASHHSAAVRGLGRRGCALEPCDGARRAVVQPSEPSCF